MHDQPAVWWEALLVRSSQHVCQLRRCSAGEELEPSVKLLVELLYGFHARLALRLGLSIVGRQPLLTLSADREVVANAGGPHDVHW